MARVFQSEAFAPNTALTVSGGATPAVTGQWIDVGQSSGNISLVLENSLTSQDLSVTYQLGYIKRADEKVGTVTPITPADGGIVTDLTNANIPAGAQHGTISVATGMKYRFTVTNNDAVGGRTAGVTLYVLYQVST